METIANRSRDYSYVMGPYREPTRTLGPAVGADNDGYFSENSTRLGAEITRGTV